MQINIKTYGIYDYVKRVNSKRIIVWFFYIVSFFVLCHLFVFSDTRPDYGVYESIFYGIYPDHEIGYIALNRFILGIGFDFKQFLFFVSNIGLIVAFYTFYKSCKMQLAILITYIWFPFIIDGIQIRSFLANIIIIFAFRYLLYEKKGNTLKYILCVFLATSMHYYAFIYIVLLIARIRFNTKQFSYFSVAVSLVGIIIFRGTSVVASLMSTIFGAGSKVATNFYMERGFGFVIPILMQSIHYFLFYKAYLIRKKNCNLTVKNSLCARGDEYSIQELDIYGMDVLLRVNVLFMLLLFPFYTYYTAFFRVYRSLFIINSIFIFNTAFDVKKRLNKKGISINMICSVIYVLIVGIMMGNNFAHLGEWISFI